MIMTLLERYKNGETKAVYDDIAKMGSFLNRPCYN